jgi:glucose/arabinose dehydrogenase
MTLVRLVLSSLWLGLAPASGAASLNTSAGPVQMQLMARGLEEPWSLGFLPDGQFLVTERDGRVWTPP